MLAQWVQHPTMGASWRTREQRAKTAGPLLPRLLAANCRLCFLRAAMPRTWRTPGDGKASKAARMKGCTQAPSVMASPSSWDTGCYGNEGCINTRHQSAIIPWLRKVGWQVNESPQGRILSCTGEESREGFPLLPVRSSVSAALGCVLPHHDVLPWSIRIYKPICLFRLPPPLASRAHEDKTESRDRLSDTRKYGPAGTGGSERWGRSESASR